MAFLYTTGIQLYNAAVHIAALWNPKARQWVKGRKAIFENIRQTLSAKTKKRLWMHVASLGEFEQGLPVIEKFDRAEWEIVVTFFSPSGYEYRKKHPAADAVFYLPVDTAVNAARFLDIVQPNLVLFVKYDFWYHYLTQTAKRKIPLYLISALFRPGQPFFKNSALHRKMLLCFNHIFTQDDNSVKLLDQHGYTNATQAGDTRCDRVLQNAQQPKHFPLIEKFAAGKKVLVAGSSWPEEETLLADVYPAFANNLKLVITPHNISEAHVAEIEKRFSQPTIRYSKLTAENANQYNVVIIDNIGMLSSLYQYGHIALIGGAFRKGLHNILEAAVFSIPVLYGPPIKKYPEGHRLAHAGGGIIIKDTTELKAALHGFTSDENQRRQTGQKARQFILDNAGAAEKIYKIIYSSV